MVDFSFPTFNQSFRQTLDGNDNASGGGFGGADTSNSYTTDDLSITNTDEGHVINEPNGGDSSIDTQSSDPNITTSTYSPGSGTNDSNTHSKTTTTSIDPKDLDSAINAIWEMMLGTNLFAGNNLADVGQQIGSFLRNLETYFNEVSNLDENTRWQYASQIYNMVSSYMMYQLQNYYSRQNWIFENEYNSPINQIARLVQSGINPAFYFSSSSKDTAGEIGGTDAKESSMAGVDGSTKLQTALGDVENALAIGGSLASVGSDVGNLFNLVSQAKLANITGEDIVGTRTGRNAQTFANAGYLSSLANKETVTLPLLKEQMRTTSLLNEATIENYAITANQRWAEMEQNMRIADMQINSSQFIAQLRANADKEIADMTSSRQLQGVQFSSKMAYLGTKYSADKNYEASKYATDEQVKHSRWCKNLDRRMGLELKAMDNMYDDVFFTNYVDETTGKRSHSFAGLGLNVDDYGKVEFGMDGTAMVNGHRIRRDEVKSHVFNYGRMQYANQTILNLVRYNDEDYVPSSTMFHYAKEYDNVFNRAFFNWALPKMSAAFGSYMSDSFMNIGSVGDNANQGNMNGFIWSPNAGGLNTGLKPAQ